VHYLAGTDLNCNFSTTNINFLRKGYIICFFKEAETSLMVGYINLLNKLKLYNNYPVYYIGGSEALPPPLTNDEEIIF